MNEPGSLTSFHACVQRFLSSARSDICTLVTSPPQHEEQAGEQDRRRWTEAVAHGPPAGGPGSAGGELPEDPDSAGGEAKGVTGLHLLRTSRIQTDFFFFFSSFDDVCNVLSLTFFEKFLQKGKKKSIECERLFTSRVSHHSELVWALFSEHRWGHVMSLTMQSVSVCSLAHTCTHLQKKHSPIESVSEAALLPVCVALYQRIKFDNNKKKILSGFFSVFPAYLCNNFTYVLTCSGK